MKTRVEFFTPKRQTDIQMLGILLTTLIFIGVLVGSSFMINITEVKKNWGTYRCRPDVMLMAPLYGQDSAQNLEFCLKKGFDDRAATATSPFYTYLASFTGVLSTLLGGINSTKMIFATIVGTATTVFSQFSQRIQALFYRVQITAIRMKFLMSRVFASMYGIMFMGLSGIKAGQNFGNTALWGFLDTFCFDPDTLIFVKGSGLIPIKNVEIGDVLEGGEKVTATFQFAADGQAMVKLGDVLVSTNHYLLAPGKVQGVKWIQAKDHPDARIAGEWSGGLERPLICLNTDTHSFNIGGYVFKDYDETSEGDKEAMEEVMKMLNGLHSPSASVDSAMGCDPETILKCPGSPGSTDCTGSSFNKCIKAKDIILGDELSHGKVAGIVKKLTTAVCYYKGERFSPGTSIWCEEENKWMRASELAVPFIENTPAVFLSFIVSPSATIETESGLMFRDYVEIHSPDLEKPYANAINNESNLPPYWKCMTCGYGPNPSKEGICGSYLYRGSSLPKCSGKRPF